MTSISNGANPFASGSANLQQGQKTGENKSVTIRANGQAITVWDADNDGTISSGEVSEALKSSGIEADKAPSIFGQIQGKTIAEIEDMVGDSDFGDSFTRTTTDSAETNKKVCEFDEEAFQAEMKVAEELTEEFGYSKACDLAAIGEATTEEELEKYLNNEDETIQKAAYERLGEIYSHIGNGTKIEKVSAQFRKIEEATKIEDIQDYTNSDNKFVKQKAEAKILELVKNGEKLESNRFIDYELNQGVVRATAEKNAFIASDYNRKYPDSDHKLPSGMDEYMQDAQGLYSNIMSNYRSNGILDNLPARQSDVNAVLTSLPKNRGYDAFRHILQGGNVTRGQLQKIQLMLPHMDPMD